MLKLTGGNQLRDHVYCYDAAWRLTNVKTGSCSGSTVIGLGYDVQGNLANKSGKATPGRMRRGAVMQTLPEAATVDPVASGKSGENYLAARYRAAVRARIEAVWLQLAGTATPRACSLAIRQQAGGTVLSARVVDCDLDGPTRDQLEAVALMAQPLPYAGFEWVLVGELQVDMRPAAGH